VESTLCPLSWISFVRKQEFLPLLPRLQTQGHQLEVERRVHRHLYIEHPSIRPQLFFTSLNGFGYKTNQHFPDWLTSRQLDLAGWSPHRGTRFREQFDLEARHFPLDSDSYQAFHSFSRQPGVVEDRTVALVWPSFVCDKTLILDCYGVFSFVQQRILWNQLSVKQKGLLIYLYVT
jgi:hypothetical protein